MNTRTDGHSDENPLNSFETSDPAKESEPARTVKDIDPGQLTGTSTYNLRRKTVSHPTTTTAAALPERSSVLPTVPEQTGDVQRLHFDDVRNPPRGVAGVKIALSIKAERSTGSRAAADFALYFWMVQYGLTATERSIDTYSSYSLRRTAHSRALTRIQSRSEHSALTISAIPTPATLRASNAESPDTRRVKREVEVGSGERR
ncbi:unnamed protein product [Echinostoma caproni]|uniref:Uncharacterized protein n=1 Tax=Echinostoma caproni TaxID=27848 RepID=A0A3P8GCV8_9TREM|nr:unnamed protein product [Echinostoma caproni]